LEEILDPAFRDSHPPKFIESSHLEKEPKPSTEDYNEEEKREITDMLKDLGYID
jgi:hypothetical protein